MKRARPVTAERLLKVIDTFEDRRIVVLGDLVTDEFLYGDIARISREAPVLILELRRTVVVPGGGGNAVANLRALDAVPLPVGIVGRDSSGTAMVEQFREAGIPVAGVRMDAGYSTPTKSRVLAGGVHTRRQQIVRIDRGEAQGVLTGTRLEAVRQRFRKALGRAEGVLLADYGYGVAHPDLLRVIPAATRKRLVIAVDSRSRVEAFRGVTVCTPNQEELENFAAPPKLASDQDVRRAGDALLRKTGNTSVVVTRGAKGMVLFRRGAAPVPIAPYGTDEVADVTGAGDTVTAAITLALASGASPLEAALLANFAAGLVVMKAGTATVNRDELARAVTETLS